MFFYSKSYQVSKVTQNLKLHLIERHDGWVVIQPRGEIDFYTSPRLRQWLQLLDTANKHRIVIDLKDVSLLDSSGLSALVSGLKKTRENDGDLRLVGACPTVRKVLNITKLDQQFKMSPDIEKALVDNN